MDPITGLIAGAALTGIFTLTNSVITVLMQKKVRETHRQVTVNHHSSSNPTVLDMLSDLAHKVDNNHKESQQEFRKVWDALSRRR